MRTELTEAQKKARYGDYRDPGQEPHRSRYELRFAKEKEWQERVNEIQRKLRDLIRVRF